MASKKITPEEFRELIRPHQAALLELARRHNVPLVIGIDTSEISGQPSWWITMYADGPVCPPVSVAMQAMSAGTDRAMVELADELLAPCAGADFGGTAGSRKIGRA